MDSPPVTVLFADVAGSTTLYERLGDSAALARIAECLARAEEIATRVGGRMVKRIGDGFMCAFWDAADALGAAADMQLAQSAYGDGLGLRIGFHTGAAIEQAHDLFGYSVNVAARIAGMAQAGQILTTAPTVKALPDYMRRALRYIGPLPLRGKSDPVEAYEAIWHWNADTTDVGQSAALAAAAESTLVIEYGGIVYRLVDTGAQLTFGRSELCDVVVDHPAASRMHARIEAVDGYYVLHDLSSNGTYLRIADDSEFLLRRAQAPLRLRGLIGLGVTTRGDEPTLQFRCD